MGHAQTQTHKEVCRHVVAHRWISNGTYQEHMGYIEDTQGNIGVPEEQVKEGVGMHHGNVRGPIMGHIGST